MMIEIENKKIGLINLGCPKNLVDAEVMLGRLGEEGFIICQDITDADIVIINSCSFLEEGIRECKEVVKEISGLRRKGLSKKIVLTGCAIGRFGRDVINVFPEVDYFLGMFDRKKIVEICRGLTKEKYVRCDEEKVEYEGTRFRLTARHYAYLKISDGCNHRCSFCVIPKIKGRYKSKDEDVILDEVKELVQDGVKEIILIGQDTSYYMKEKGVKDGLSRLLWKIAEVEGVEWLRIMYVHPLYVSDELIKTIRDCKKIVKYIDMPVQHSSDKILKLMRRGTSRRYLFSLIEKIREEIPDVTLRTTVIVGFPCEDESDFEDLMGFVRRVKFERLGCFKYSREKNSFSYRMKPQISEDVKQKRFETIMSEQQSIIFEKQRAKIGKIVEVIIDGKTATKNGYGFYGRATSDAPEIDCLVYFKEGENMSVGEIVKARIIGVENYDLMGERVNPKF